MARLLVADDEADLVEIIEKVLVRSGHEVETACDGLEALRRLSLGGIALVIIDIVMPNMNGLDLIKEIRKKDPKVKIIAISGGGGGGQLATESYLSVAKQLGASCCLLKPFTPVELSEAVTELLRPDTFMGTFG